MDVILKLIFLVFAIKSQKNGSYEITPDMDNEEIFNIYLNKTKFLIDLTGKKIIDCFEEKFQNDVEASAEKIKIACSGQFNEIINRTYKKGMDLLHVTFLDILNEELKPFKDELENEIFFFYNKLKMIIDKDYEISNTFHLMKRGLKYHVDPKKFENLCKILHDKIEIFEEIYMNLISQRNSISKTADAKVKQREESLANMLLKKNKK